MSSDDGEKVTPVPIPNTEVKLLRADGTWTAGSWESRSSLGNRERPDLIWIGSFFHDPVLLEMVGLIEKDHEVFLITVFVQAGCESF